MRIPLPKMMRHLREREFDRGLGSQSVRTGIRIWAFYAKRPELYRALANLKFSILGFLGRGKGRFRWLPGAGGWTSIATSRHRNRAAPSKPGGTGEAVRGARNHERGAKAYSARFAKAWAAAHWANPRRRRWKNGSLREAAACARRVSISTRMDWRICSSTM